VHLQVWHNHIAADHHRSMGKVVHMAVLRTADTLHTYVGDMAMGSRAVLVVALAASSVPQAARRH
jgi:hypothetical protein